MKPFVKNLAEYAVHNAPKGIRYWKIASGSSIERQNEVDLVPVPHGRDIPGHIHKRSNALVLILSGSGIAEIGNERREIDRFDVVNIPAGTYHAFEASPKEDLMFVSVQYPPIGNDYVFSRSIERNLRFPPIRRLAAYAAAGILAASLLTIDNLYNENRNLRSELETQKVLREIEDNDYIRGIENGMLEYRKQLETIFGPEKAREIERKAPYPVI